jgi:hypothetical protein
VYIRNKGKEFNRKSGNVITIIMAKKVKEVPIEPLELIAMPLKREVQSTFTSLYVVTRVIDKAINRAYGVGESKRIQGLLSKYVTDTETSNFKDLARTYYNQHDHSKMVPVLDYVKESVRCVISCRIHQNLIVALEECCQLRLSIMRYFLYHKNL